jgi:hypothetical protein
VAAPKYETISTNVPGYGTVKVAAWRVEAALDTYLPNTYRRLRDHLHSHDDETDWAELKLTLPSMLVILASFDAAAEREASA